MSINRVSLSPFGRNGARSGTGAAVVRLAVLSILIGVIFGASGRAASITLGAGVKNPPPSLSSTGLNPKQTAIADTAAVVKVADVAKLLQSILDAQGFTGANNWTLSTNTSTLDPKAVFNLTSYQLYLNGGGTAFGEEIKFTLDPNLAKPNVPAGATASLHWLQYVNTDSKVNGFGFSITGQPGYWQLDNGQKNGGKAAGPATGPYYDSNDGAGFSTPPSFFDSPHFYSGVGTYLHFTAIPTWDLFTPASGGNPATEIISVADYGISWGFQIVPEPSSIVLIVTGSVVICGVALLRRDADAGAGAVDQAA